MSTLNRFLLGALAVGALTSLAAPPTPPAGTRAPLADPSAVVDDGPSPMQQRGHVAMVVAISEALELNEADALKMSEKLKGLEEKRQPIRAQMHEAMRAVRAAAGGDAAALAQVDANVQKVLDGRAQMAAMDKELFTFLAKDLPPQKRAKLALVLAHLGQLRGQGGQGGMGGPGGTGPRRPWQR